MSTYRSATLSNKRLIVALVGVGHTGGGFNPENVVLDAPAA
jgi:hypothetical protein